MAIPKVRPSSERLPDARIASYASVPDFSIVVIPDTQYLVGAGVEDQTLYNAHAQWIVDNQVTYNIQAVLHVGDIVNLSNGTSDARADTEYTNCLTAYDRVFTAGIPMLVATGNHDTADWTTWTWVKYNQYFPLTKFTSETWWNGGVYTPGQSENIYTKLNVGGMKIIIMALAWNAPTAVRTWALGVANANPDHEVILAVHDYIYFKGYRSITGSTATGVQVWDEFVKQTTNVRLVVCGHHGKNSVDEEFINQVQQGLSFADDGHGVFESFQNWQYLAKTGDPSKSLSGDGRLRLFTVSGSNNTISTKTYNPVTAAFSETEKDISFPFILSNT